MEKILLSTIIFFTVFNGWGQELSTYTAEAGNEHDYESIMISLKGGCSLGCAIGWSLDASSTLSVQGTNTYLPENMDDGERETAWVEGKTNYGIGEKIVIRFDSNDNIKNVPFDGMQLINGYAKSQTTWEDNSRVKLFKLHLNGQPQFFIELQDSIYPQRVNWGRGFLISEGDVVELEIIDVYKGNKWKDTAISDLSLNGAH